MVSKRHGGYIYDKLGFVWDIGQLVRGREEKKCRTRIGLNFNWFILPFLLCHLS